MVTDAEENKPAAPNHGELKREKLTLNRNR